MSHSTTLECALERQIARNQTILDEQPLDLSEFLLPLEETEDPTVLEHRGFDAFYHGTHRSDLATDAERRGFDDAAGEFAYHLAMMEEVDLAQSGHCDWRWA